MCVCKVNQPEYYSALGGDMRQLREAGPDIFRTRRRLRRLREERSGLGAVGLRVQLEREDAERRRGDEREGPAGRDPSVRGRERRRGRRRRRLVDARQRLVRLAVSRVVENRLVLALPAGEIARTGLK